MQQTFGDAENLGQCKQTRSELFLAEMEQALPWTPLLALIELHFPSLGRPGRQPYPRWPRCCPFTSFGSGMH